MSTTYRLHNDRENNLPTLAADLAAGRGGALMVDIDVPGATTLALLRSLTDLVAAALAPVPDEPVPPPPPEPAPEPLPAPEPAPEPAPPVTPALFTPSADTKTVYVSSSEGSDTFDGLAPDRPKKTIAAGIALLRNGYPDWLLLKKGDVWNEAIGAWKKYGRSASEPMVVWSYGPGTTRPELRTGSSPAIKCDGGGGTPAHVHSVVFSGLALWAHTRDPQGGFFAGSTGNIGINWLRHSTDILFDDLFVSSYVTGINIQNYDGTGVSNVTIRRCVIVDCYGIENSYHAQGVYASGVHGLLIEDCVLDGNGWRDGVTGAGPTIYNHNLYLQYDNSLDVVVRRNVISRASSHGIQLRSGGTIEDNFFYRNPINIFCGYDTPVAGAAATVQGNTVLEGTDINASNPRGFGITLKNLVAAHVRQNIVAHQASSKVNRRSIEVLPVAVYEGNIVYDWPVGYTGRGWGETLETPGPWQDGDRNVKTYCESLQIPPDEFFARIRAQSRAHFDARLTAGAINAYVRDGFRAPG